MNFDPKTTEVREPGPYGPMNAEHRSQMLIAIPSAGRADTMRTLSIWPEEWLASTCLFVPAEEEEAYRSRYPYVRVEAVGAQGIAATRQHIWQHCEHEFLCQVSDDVCFYRREPDLKLKNSDAAHVCSIFDRLLNLLFEGWEHCGLSTRSGNNRVEFACKAIGRMNDVYAHRVPGARAAGVRWDRVPVMEDFDATLQLLRLGHPNAIIYDAAWGQSASNAPGGCSAYRTATVQEEGARALAALHPGFVTVVQKASPSWGGGMEQRHDVRISWREAYHSAFTGQESLL